VAGANINGVAAPASLQISLGDLLEISVFDTPDLSSRLRVNNRGDILLPLAGYVHVQGLTAPEAAQAVAKKLVDAQLMLKPEVSVFIAEYATQGVTMAGEIRAPGVYPLLGPRTLLDMVTMAGGLGESASKVISIIHRSDPSKVITVRMNVSVQTPESFAAESYPVLPGDTIFVARSGVVYIVGDLRQPGGYQVEHNDRLTLLDAIALAGGPTTTSRLSDARLIRKGQHGREELQVDLHNIYTTGNPGGDRRGHAIFVVQTHDEQLTSRKAKVRMKDGARVLLFGPTGQVGMQFTRLAAGSFQLVPVDRANCDLTDAAAVRDVVRKASPDAIVNAAAYTAVDKAESDEATCFAVNAEAPAAMAGAACELGIPLVHYSTDYVFNGQKSGAYEETDATGPLGVYGRSKLLGEQKIAAQGGRFVVLRTSWVYDAVGANFLRTMLRVGAERPELRIVSDQVGAPTAARAIADATLRILKKESPPSGVYHMTAAGSTSWFGFAERIFALSDMEKTPKLTPISTAEYPTPAKRPANSVLSNAKFEQAFGFRLAPWEVVLGDVMASLAAEKKVAAVS
jgi:dTDP-4-dehydrorhamnose reductase